MSSSWKDSFITPKAISHEVGGSKHFFYPISIRRLARLKVLGGPVIKALTVFFAKDSDDVRKITTETEATKTEPSMAQCIIEDIKPELATLRAKQKATAIDELLDALTAEQNIALVGEMIVDSMRELFPPESKDNPQGLEVTTFFNVIQLREALTGVFKANAEVFGPLTTKVTQAIKDVLQRTPGKTSTTPS